MKSSNHCRRALLAFLTAALLLLQGVAEAQNAEAQTWKINIKNADLREFVAQVAAITGKTFVVDPRIKGNVTVISNAAMDEDAVYALFLSVLRVHNFIAMPSGDVIRVIPNAQGKQTPGPEGQLSEIASEELVTRVIAAQNVESAELVKILRPLIPQYGHIAAVAKPNIVIVSDHADNLLRLMEIVEQIDVADEDDIVMVNLEHAWVGTVVAMLEMVAPEQIGRGATGPQRIQLIANERNNSLVVRGKSRPVAEILKLVAKLDVPATSSGSTQVFTLKHADAANVAEILNSLVSEQGAGTEEGLPPPTIQADESLNAIVVRADRDKMAEVQLILEDLDVRRSQVLIEAAIVEISLDDQEALGIEFAGVDAEGKTSPLFTTSVNGVVNSLIGSLVPEDGGDDPNFASALGSLNSPTVAVTRLDPDGFSFAAVVQALSTSTAANLLSTPSILTLDNQEAKIVVGTEVPFRTGSFTTTGDGSDNPFTTIQREDVGLQLTVTPHVHDGTSVRLDVNQEITNVLPQAPIGSTAFSDVVTSKRTIETTVLAEDRQTIVLGGLIEDNVTSSESRVPFFSSIPGLGRLFRSNNDTTTRRNLLIFLRPTVIRTVEEATAATERKYQDVWEVEILSRGEPFPVPEEPAELFKGYPNP